MSNRKGLAIGYGCSAVALLVGALCVGVAMAEKDKEAVGKDVTPPVVLLHQPADGQTYAAGEAVWINWQASDNAGLRSAELLIDGVSVHTWDLKRGGPWVTSYGVGGCVPQTCNGLPVGSHTVGVVVIDKGHNETSVVVEIEVGP